jgi:FG-GAP-like repeat
MIYSGSLRHGTNATTGTSRVRSRRVSCVLSAAALVVATWGSAHADAISGNLTSASFTMNGRLFLDGIEKLCNDIKPFPGESGTAVPFRYATNTFTNTGPSGCVTFKLVSNTCAHLSIYAGALSFNPANKAASYIGDTGIGSSADELSVFLNSGSSVTLVVTGSGRADIPPPDCPFTIQADITPAAHALSGFDRSDIIWRQNNTGTVALWLLPDHAGFGSFDTSFGSVPANWRIIGQRDFDANGQDDLLWRDTNTGTVAIWFFVFPATVGSTAGVGTVPPNWSVVGIGDFNADSKGDLLWRDTSGNVAIWLMNGAQVAQTAVIGQVPAVWSVAAVADFNGDGRADILWHNTSTGQAAIWFMNGVTVTSTAVIGTVPTSWSIVATGDFNADSMADIVWRDIGGNVAIWLMNGASILQTGSLGAVPTYWVIVETGDFEGNGKADILWRDTNTGTVAIWFMNGLVVASTTNLGAVPSDWVIQNVNVN